MDIETATKVRDLFDECSTLYECRTSAEIVADYAELVAEVGEDNPVVFGYWLGILLSVEDASGAPTAMIRDIRKRLRLQGWKIYRELPSRLRRSTQTSTFVELHGI